ncbi:MAG: cytochrome c maturation protein CcmE [Actinobacteria bacterium]|nr:cytochrome c maturation protein CcmE [Actinomycetota bacterium]
MSPQSPPVSKQRRTKFLVGTAVVALTLFGLVGWAMSRPGSTSFYLEVSELDAGGPLPSAQEYRVNGRVVPGSVEQQGLETSFALTDGRADVTVVTTEPLPDTFKDRSDVVARGRYDGRTFTASEVLAKCPSKFKAKA